MDQRTGLETLFHEHSAAMLRLARMLLHDEDESRDIVHDVFAALAEQRGEPRAESIRAYLLSSVRNRCLNRIRTLSIQERAARLILLEQEAADTSADQMEAECMEVRQAVSQLWPPVARRVVEMHFREGYTFREIAERLAVSETTVYKHLRHALQQLRTQLKAR